MRGERRHVVSLGSISRSIDSELAAAGAAPASAPAPAPAPALASTRIPPPVVARERIDTPTQRAVLLGSEFVVERWEAATEAWKDSILEIKGEQLSETRARTARWVPPMYMIRPRTSC